MLRIRVPTYRQYRLTDEELEHFYRFIDHLQPNVRAAFYLLIGSGARVSEVTNLTKDDFLFKDGRLFVNIEDAKYDSDRIIPILHAQVVEVLKNYLASLDVSSLHSAGPAGHLHPLR